MAGRPPQPRSVLAIDVGRRRIGLAGCDPLGISITPLQALLRSSFGTDLSKLQRLVQERQVRALVVGLPLDQTGSPTPQAEHCRRYGERLARQLQLPLAWVNEHSSSWAAAERHGLQGDRSGALDSAAAALLLAQWLQDGPEPQPVTPQTIDPGQAAAAASS
ncbi:MAG: Holliday junction resolvase RuvX [Cyanobacteriota bacterium]|nr:Holliday junction resolvase RuvX [Cyanobacteriota bacterium]